MNLQNENTLKQISISKTMQMWNSAATLCGNMVFKTQLQIHGKHCYQWMWSLTVCHVFGNSIAQFHYKGALFLGGLCMSLVWISKPVILRMEEGDMSLSIFYYCVCAFLCRSFNPSLPFMLLLFQGPDVACRNFYPNRASIKCLSALFA